MNEIDTPIAGELPDHIAPIKVLVEYFDDQTEQSISLETRNEGAGTFIVIKTEEFSLNNPEELIHILKDFTKRT